MAGKASAAMLRLASYETQRAGATPAQQAVLGPEAHQAFAQAVGQSGSPALVGAVAAGTPIYTFAKEAVQRPGTAFAMGAPGAIGLMIGTMAKAYQARSPASFKEMGAAYQGLADGLKERWFGK